MPILQAARASGQIPFDDVALSGAQIHAVVPDAEAFRQPVRELLESNGIKVNAVDWIAPTLEDVFISSVKPEGVQS
jgi:hypothetical protein